jgi:anoctamin-10/anoctamin-7
MGEKEQYDGEIYEMLTGAQREFVSCLMRSKQGGLQTALFLSKDKDELYLKFRAPLDVLLQEADRINYGMTLESRSLQQVCADGFPEKNIKPITLGPIRPDMKEQLEFNLTTVMVTVSTILGKVTVVGQAGQPRHTEAVEAMNSSVKMERVQGRIEESAAGDLKAGTRYMVKMASSASYEPVVFLPSTCSVEKVTKITSGGDGYSVGDVLNIEGPLLVHVHAKWNKLENKLVQRKARIRVEKIQRSATSVEGAEVGSVLAVTILDFGDYGNPVPTWDTDIETSLVDLGEGAENAAVAAIKARGIATKRADHACPEKHDQVIEETRIGGHGLLVNISWVKAEANMTIMSVTITGGKYAKRTGEVVHIAGGEEYYGAPNSNHEYVVELDPNSETTQPGESLLEPGDFKPRQRVSINGKYLKVGRHSGKDKYMPHDHIYAQYELDDDVMQNVYRKYGTRYSPSKRILLRSSDRIKLIMSILKSVLRRNKLPKIKSLLIAKNNNVIADYTALHDVYELNELGNRWWNPRYTAFHMPNDQPFDDIVGYFGEKIGLYFVWLATYTNYLVYAAIMGFGVWIEVQFSGSSDPDTLSAPPFGLAMCLWSTIYMENWKKKQNQLAMEWGMKGFEEEEDQRAEFRGKIIKCPITGEEVTFAHPGIKFWKLIISWVVTLLCLCCVLGSYIAIFYTRYRSSPEKMAAVGEVPWTYFTYQGEDYSQMACDLLVTAQIIVFNEAFIPVAVVLTEFENQETDTQFEDNLIFKLFFIQFFNSFAGLFYIAFIKQLTPDHCANDNCMAELNQALMTVMIGKMGTGNFSELVMPYAEWYANKKQEDLSLWVKKLMAPRKKKLVEEEVENDSDKAAMREEAKQLLETLPNKPQQADGAEFQFHKPVYDDGKGKGLFRDYAEMIQQFGYASLFVTCFPLAPVLSLVNNYLEIRIDANKLCCGTRRPIPKGAEDIGTWFVILEVMSISAVITNSLIICFTSKKLMEELNITRAYDKLTLFIVLEHCILMSKYLYGMLIPDTTHYVQVQMERQAYLQKKVVHKAPDDDDEELEFKMKMREEGVGFGDDDVCFEGEEQANVKSVVDYQKPASKKKI